MLKRNPFYRGDRPANVDQVVYTISESQEACQLAVEQDRIDHCKYGLPATSYRALAEKYGINRPGGQFFVSPMLTTWFVAFNHDRPAFRGPGQIPLAKAINYAIDRPAMVRAFGYLAGKRTDQLLPPALARPASIYPLGGADPATARKWLARAKLQPNSASPLRGQHLIRSRDGPGARLRPQADRCRPRGEVLRQQCPRRQDGDPGEPFDLALDGWNADYADAAGFFVPILDRGSGMGVNLDDPLINGASRRRTA